MNRFLGGLFEGLHVLSIAALFGVGAMLTWLTCPDLLPEQLSIEGAARLAGRVIEVMGTPARVLAVTALICAVLAPYIRNDAVKKGAWARTGLCAIALLVILYAFRDGGVNWGDTASMADVEAQNSARAALKMRSDKGPTPWNSMMVLAGANLLVLAFQHVISAKPKK